MPGPQQRETNTTGPAPASDAAHLAGMPAVAPLLGGPPTSQSFTRARIIGWATKAPIAILVAAVLGIITLFVQWTGVIGPTFGSGAATIMLTGFIAAAAVSASSLASKQGGTALSAAVVGLVMGLNGLITAWEDPAAIGADGHLGIGLALLLAFDTIVMIAGVLTGIGWAVRKRAATAAAQSQRP